MHTKPASAAERLADIARTIVLAGKRFGPEASKVELVAVSKTFPAEDIEPFLAAGQRVFGENRVQEAKSKWPELRLRYPDAVLHLIGPLQTNKAREAVEIFDVIETLDRDKLAVVLAEEMARAGKALPVFVQVNIGGEAQKSGIDPNEAVAFVRRCREVHGLTVLGLMCIPPDGQPAGAYFAHLAVLALQAEVDGLSMGMSGDFEVAIAMGSTHIRLGSALFGHRPKVPAAT